MTTSSDENAAWVRMVTTGSLRRERLAAASSGGVVVFASAASATGDRDAKGERELLLAVAFAHPRDARIKFVEDIHAYFLDGERVPISVTGFYMRYFREFEADAEIDKRIERWRGKPSAKYYELLRELSEQGASVEVQKRVISEGWRLNGNTQSSLGTATHRAIELVLNGEEMPPAPPPPVEREHSDDENDDGSSWKLEEARDPVSNLFEGGSHVFSSRLRCWRRRSTCLGTASPRSWRTCARRASRTSSHRSPTQKDSRRLGRTLRTLLSSARGSWTTPSSSLFAPSGRSGHTSFSSPDRSTPSSITPSLESFGW